MKAGNSKKAEKILLIVSGVMTSVILGISDILLFPSIEKTTEGLRSFDLNSFGYSFEQAKTFVSLLGENGKNIYLHIELPLDCIFPIFYGVFFILLLVKARDKKDFLIAFPVLLVIFDYIENSFTFYMLNNDFSEPTAMLASTSTVIKSGLMSVNIILILIFGIIRLAKNSKNKNKLLELSE